MAVIPLTGLTADNPLAFLATLGTFRVLADVLEPIGLHWTLSEGTWRPALTVPDNGLLGSEPVAIARLIGERLGVSVRPAEPGRLEAVKRAEETFSKARKEFEKREKALLRQAADAGIKGQELAGFLCAGLAECRAERDLSRSAWLAALRAIAHSPELALGKTIKATNAEFRALSGEIAAACVPEDRLLADLMAGFGAELSDEQQFIEPTAFCFVTGSGQQFFLGTIQQLLEKVTVEKIERMLFKPWDYPDSRYSLRWDPAEDRRHALMWEDPTAPGNEPRTLWAANLLAYYALALLPCFAAGRSLRTTGFAQRPPVFSWPVWTSAIGLDTLRSLLASSHLQERPLKRPLLAAMGVHEVMQATRIRVGTPPLFKINFSQVSVA